MNVLLITFSFPPAGGVGVLRALSLAKYLPSNDIRVDVLTARNAPAVGRDLSLLAQVPDTVNVHRAWTLDMPFALRKFIKRLLSGKAPETSTTSAKPASPLSSTIVTLKPPARKSNPLKRLLGNLLLPDPQIGWLPFVLPAARRIIRSRAIDAVLITVPPFSSAKLVASLRDAFPQLPIILDFRDEWLSTTIDLVSFNSNHRARRIAHETERTAVHLATAVVLVTEAARRELISRYPAEPSAKFHCIHNGFDTPPQLPQSPRLDPKITPDGPFFAASSQRVSSEPPPDSANPQPQSVLSLQEDLSKPITLTYIGSVYGSTDPSTLVAAVHALPPHLRSLLRLRFIGHIETPHLRSTLLSLGNTVELRGFLPQAEALRAINSTDWLLLVTRDRINVAAKFYDYLGGGKPILAAVHPEGDVRKLLEQTGAGAWSDVFSPPDITTLLTRILDPSAADFISPLSITPDPKVIAQFHRSILAARYADLLRSLTPKLLT